MAYGFRPVFRANLDVVWFFVIVCWSKTSFMGFRDFPRPNTMFWDGKIPSRMPNGGVPKFPHTLVNRPCQLWTAITFSSELRFTRSWTLRKAR